MVAGGGDQPASCSASRGTGAGVCDGVAPVLRRQRLRQRHGAHVGRESATAAHPGSCRPRTACRWGGPRRGSDGSARAGRHRSIHRPSARDPCRRRRWNGSRSSCIARTAACRSSRRRRCHSTARRAGSTVTRAVVDARLQCGVDDAPVGAAARAGASRLGAACLRAGRSALSSSERQRSRFQCGSANTYSVPPAVVYFGRSDMTFTMPSAAEPSRGSTGPETTAPDQPPTPESTAMY